MNNDILVKLVDLEKAIDTAMRQSQDLLIESIDGNPTNPDRVFLKDMYQKLYEAAQDVNRFTRERLTRSTDEEKDFLFKHLYG